MHHQECLLHRPWVTKLRQVRVCQSADALHSGPQCSVHSTQEYPETAGYVW